MAPQPSRTRRTWALVGTAAGILGGAAIVVTATSGVALPEGAERPGALSIVGGAVATAALAGLVGMGVGVLVEQGFSPAVMAVGGALGALLVAPVLPLQPVPLVVALGALAREQRRWVRLVAAAGVVLGIGWIVGVPTGALLIAGGSETADAGVLIGHVFGLGVAFSAYGAIGPGRGTVLGSAGEQPDEPA